jgi:hypothetical protein
MTLPADSRRPVRPKDLTTVYNFLRTATYERDDAYVTLGRLHHSHELWAYTNGFTPVPIAPFKSAVRQAGFEFTRRDGVRAIDGINVIKRYR